MELKHIKALRKASAIFLLIVPYGIETSERRRGGNHVTSLLIVPYGIETLYNITSYDLQHSFNRTLWN